jgi:hypothetical protein
VHLRGLVVAVAATCVERRRNDVRVAFVKAHVLHRAARLGVGVDEEGEGALPRERGFVGVQ